MRQGKQFTNKDRIWMQRALSLAELGRGYVSPNPLVGCVIVDKNNDVIGEGYHERFGQPHAEVQAVRSVTDKNNLEGANVYVTLEPCSHHGKTPPCADMLAKLPLDSVYVAMKDPTEKVSGKGIERLKKSGIRVFTGLLENEARELNEFWLHYVEFGRPFVTLKIAQTADGYIAAPNGDSKWISGIESRELVHKWRSIYDGVMIGRNTARLDNPKLTVRLVEGRNPRRIVIDGPFELPRELNILSDENEQKTIVITHNADKAAATADPMLKILQSNYFRGETIVVDKHRGHTDLRQALLKLGDAGITSVLVEGGQSLSSAFIKAGLVDRLLMFISPKLLGGGTKSIIGLGINRMEEIVTFRDYGWKQAGEDILITAEF